MLRTDFGARPGGDNKEVDRDETPPVADGELHQLRRGTKYTAAHHLGSIVANDDRPRTMHVEAQQTDRELLPDIIRGVLERDDERLIPRGDAWRQRAATARGFRATYTRPTAAAASAGRGRDIDSLEL
jgi:hypothetical protein